MDRRLRPAPRSPIRTAAAPSEPAGASWAALLALAATTFVVVSGEMLPTAVLPRLAADLDVEVASAGLLVSAWAATVVVVSVPLARLTARFPRRRVIAGGLLVVSVATLVTAAADAFAVAALSRIVGAAATGVLWATLNAQVADMVPDHRLGRATAIVLTGGTLGTVLAVPAAAAVAGAWGWRWPFVALAVLGLLVTAAVLGALPPAGRPAARKGTARPGASPMRPVALLGALGGVLLAAHFAAFTFITELLDGPAGGMPASALLLVFGATSVGGVAAAGRSGDRFPRGTVVGVGALLSASLAAVAVLGLHPLLDVLLVGVWGIATGAVGPAVQTRMMRAAGVAHRDTAGALVPVVFNLGIALGATLGSAVVAGAGVALLPAPATALALVATLGLSLAVGVLRLHRRPATRPARERRQHPPVVATPAPELCSRTTG
ncbi:MFS transporter [Blastococcus sp. SYSU DS0552]